MGKRISRSETRLKSKYCRELAAAIKAAGGECIITAKMHFRVTNPANGRVAFVSSGESSPRVRYKAVADIRRYTGLVVVL